MKSQVSSGCAAALASRSWARFSPASVMPASARTPICSSGTYLVAARISTDSPTCARTSARLARTRSTTSGATPRPPGGRWCRGRAGARRTARTAGGAQAAVVDLGDARGLEAAARRELEVEVPAAGDLGREPRADLVADLVAAGSDPGPDGGADGA